MRERRSRRWRGLGLAGLALGWLTAMPAAALPVELRFAIVVTGFSDDPVTDVSALSLGDHGTSIAGFDTDDLAIVSQSASGITLRQYPSTSGHLSHEFFGVGYDGSSGGDEEFVISLFDGQPGTGADVISVYTDNGDGTGNSLYATDPSGTAFDAGDFASLDTLFPGLDTTLFRTGSWYVTDEPDDAVYGAVIPEPGTAMLLALGLAAIARGRAPGPARGEGRRSEPSPGA